MPKDWTLLAWLQEMAPDLLKATGETFYMVGLSSLIAVVLGVPLGVLLTVTAPGGIITSPALYRILSAAVNTVRSVPFIILLVALIPFTRLLLGTSIGPGAAVVGLSVAATPFLARLVDGNLREVIPASSKQPAAWAQPHGKSSPACCCLRRCRGSSSASPCLSST